MQALTCLNGVSRSSNNPSICSKKPPQRVIKQENKTFSTSALTSYKFYVKKSTSLFAESRGICTFVAESWQSGRLRQSWKLLTCQRVRGFESPTLRQNGIKTNKKPANHKIAGFLHFRGSQNSHRFPSCRWAIRWVNLETETTHRIMYIILIYNLFIRCTSWFLVAATLNLLTLNVQHYEN